MINSSEIEDANAAIEAKGFLIEDFEFLPAEDPVTEDGVHSVTGTIKITRISNGNNRTYHAGHGSSWPADFAKDLEWGVFGNAI